MAILALVDHGQLDALRRRRPRRPDPAPVRGRLRPLGRLHRAVLRRPGVRPRAAPRPRRRRRRRRPRHGRRCGSRTAWTSVGPLAALSPFRWTSDHIALVGRVRLAAPGARGRSWPSVLPRARRRAVHAPRPRGHGGALAARASRRRSSASAARSAGRSATSCRGPSAWGIGLGLMGALLASLVGSMADQLGAARTC